MIRYHCVHVFSAEVFFSESPDRSHVSFDVCVCRSQWPHYPPAPLQRAAAMSIAMTPQEVNSKRIAAGVLAILIGSFGVHKFVLGKTTSGLIMLIGTVLCIGAPVFAVISLAEGVIYLTMSDQNFYDTYIVGSKEWF